MRTRLLNSSVLALALFLAACSEDDPKPPPTTTTPAGDAGTTDSGVSPSDCTNFATEHEQLLNAPTDSPAIKKQVTLPAP